MEVRIQALCQAAVLTWMHLAFHSTLGWQMSMHSAQALYQPVIKPFPNQQLSGKKDARDRRDALLITAHAIAERATALRAKQREKELRDAIRSFEKSGHIFAMVGEHNKAADIYVQIGEIRFILSEYPRALESYREAMELSDNNAELRCRIFSHMARTYATRGDIPNADQYSRKAIALGEQLSGQRAEAEALEARGEALYASGDSARAFELFERARALFADVGDISSQGQTFLMMAHARFLAGEPVEAVRLARQAKDLWTSVHNEDGIAQVDLAMGVFGRITGEFESARCDAEQALNVFSKMGDRDNEASALNLIGFLEREMGDPEASWRYYSRARSIFAGVDDMFGEAESITGIAKALTIMQRYRSLSQLYRSKMRLGVRARDLVLQASALADLAGVYELKRRYADAEAKYLQALNLYRSSSHILGETNVLIRLAHFYGQQGKYTQALSLLEAARSKVEKTSQIDEIAKIDYDLASIYRRLGSLGEAKDAIERTVAVIESQRLKLADFDSRASYFASMHAYYSLYIQILMLLHQENPERSFAVKAFEASERSKVRSLLDWLGRSNENMPCTKFQKTQTEGSNLEGAARDEDEKTANADLALTLDETQAEIGNGDILFEYALGDEKSYSWVANGAQISSHELPGAAQLKELVRGLNHALMAWQPQVGETATEYREQIAKARNNYREYALKLAHLLFDGVPLSAAKRLIIVPDGALQYVPFAALPIPRATSNKAILGDDHEVVVLPSASALHAIRKGVRDRPPPTRLAAVFANPIFEPDDIRVRQRASGHRLDVPLDPAVSMAWRDVKPASTYIPPLPDSHQEVLAVQSLGSDGVLAAEGFAATRHKVLNSNLGRYRFIHFATHGINDLKHPDRSGLILSRLDRHGNPLDGYLRLTDIYSLRLSADLVVLSSCDSGLGKDLESEGIFGLTRAFFRAGAKSVIATLWKVQDQPTAQLMKHFYRYIKKGETPSSALRGAQLDLRKEKQWSDPYFWAAFVLEGDYK